MVALVEMGIVEREDLVNELSKRIIIETRAQGSLFSPIAAAYLAETLQESLSDIRLAMGRVPFIINGSEISVCEDAWEIRAIFGVA